MYTCETIKKNQDNELQNFSCVPLKCLPPFTPIALPQPLRGLISLYITLHFLEHSISGIIHDILSFGLASFGDHNYFQIYSCRCMQAAVYSFFLQNSIPLYG